MIAWLFAVDAILGFNRAIGMDQLPEERNVYAFLVEYAKEPVSYVRNPEIVPGQGFPRDDPIFASHYTGLGHDNARQEIVVGLVVMLL